MLKPGEVAGSEGFNLNALWPLVAMVALAVWWGSTIFGSVFEQPVAADAVVSPSGLLPTPTRDAAAMYQLPSAFSGAATLRPLIELTESIPTLSPVGVVGTDIVSPTPAPTLTPSPSATITATATQYAAPTSTRVAPCGYLCGYPDGYKHPAYDPTYVRTMIVERLVYVPVTVPPQSYTVLVTSPPLPPVVVVVTASPQPSATVTPSNTSPAPDVTLSSTTSATTP